MQQGTIRLLALIPTEPALRDGFTMQFKSTRQVGGKKVYVYRIALRVSCLYRLSVITGLEQTHIMSDYTLVCKV